MNHNGRLIVVAAFFTVFRGGLRVSTQINTDQINHEGHLLIGGVDTTSLAKQYGTPLIAYDTNNIRQQIRNLKRSLMKSKLITKLVMPARPLRRLQCIN